MAASACGVIGTSHGELFAKFQTSFYSDPTDAVFKALGGQQFYAVVPQWPRIAVYGIGSYFMAAVPTPPPKPRHGVAARPHWGQLKSSAVGHLVVQNLSNISAQRQPWPVWLIGVAVNGYNFLKNR